MPKDPADCCLRSSRPEIARMTAGILPRILLRDSFSLNVGGAHTARACSPRGMARRTARVVKIFVCHCPVRSARGRVIFSLTRRHDSRLEIPRTFFLRDGRGEACRPRAVLRVIVVSIEVYNSFRRVRTSRLTSLAWDCGRPIRKRESP